MNPESYVVLLRVPLAIGEIEDNLKSKITDYTQRILLLWHDFNNAGLRIKAAGLRTPVRRGSNASPVAAGNTLTQAVSSK
jgi:hypothetical protein